jgi:hypothetical protein
MQNKLYLAEAQINHGGLEGASGGAGRSGRIGSLKNCNTKCNINN